MSDQPKNHAQDIDAGTIEDASQDQCIRYLLGEMSIDESSQFERRLESDPLLGDTLVAQAELFSQLGMTSSVDTASKAVPATQDNHSHVAATRWIQVIAAIAACVVAVASVWWFQSRGTARVAQKTDTTLNDPVKHNLGTDEDLMIARAWVDGPLSLALNPGDETLQESIETTSIEPLLDPNDDSSDDSILQWMMAAVTEGANHDG